MSNRKILFTASVPLHFKAFHLPYLKWFQEQGYETHVACNGYEELPYVDKIWQVDFERSPFTLKHFKAFRQLQDILNTNQYILINCHTPMASVVTRFASRFARQKGTKLIYTAHGFHFFKGAPLVSWLSFFPVELFLSRITDAIITINQEDYEIIKRYGSARCSYYKIPGIGVDGSKFFQISAGQKNGLRYSNNIATEKFILIYAAEFIHRKNHRFIVNAVKENKDLFNNIHILFAGKGPLEDDMKKLIKRYKLDGIIKFIGFRKDIHEIYQLSDVGVSASRQEGLGLNLVEEMMVGLPVVATVDRGHKEVIDNGVTGYLFKQNDSREFVDCIVKLSTDKQLYSTLSQNALKKAMSFELKHSLSAMTFIYKRYLL